MENGQARPSPRVYLAVPPAQSALPVRAGIAVVRIAGRALTGRTVLVYRSGTDLRAPRVRFCGPNCAGSREADSGPWCGIALPALFGGGFRGRMRRIRFSLPSRGSLPLAARLLSGELAPRLEEPEEGEGAKQVTSADGKLMAGGSSRSQRRVRPASLLFPYCGSSLPCAGFPHR